MTSPWPATALLLALAASVASGQNISLGHGSDQIMVPLDKLDVVPGAVIAQLGPHDAPAQAVTAWLHLFPEMTASQRLGVFLHLSDWGNQMRSALGPVADKVMESPEQLTRFLTPMEFSRQLSRFGASLKVRGNEWTREDVVDVVSRLPDAALMSWMEKIVNANEDGPLVKRDFESPNPSRPDQDGTLAILGTTCAHVSTMDPADVLFFLERYNAVSKSRVVPFSLVQCFKTKVSEMLRGKETAADPETLLDRLSEDEIPMVGFRVLSSFSAANFTRMSRRDLLRQSVALIAAQPMRELIVAMSRQKLVSLTRTFYSVEDELEASLDEMGTFVHATGEELMKAMPEKLAVLGRKLWEGKERATLCVPEEVRAKWRIALRSIYGPVDRWTKNTLLTLRDLLINLNPSDWNDLSAEALRSAADTLIAGTGYSHVYNGMPSFTNETVFYKVCQHWLGDSEGEKFGKSHFSMMRNLLLASQLNANLEPDTTIVRNTDNGASSASSQVNGTPDGQRRRRRSPIGPRPISILEDLNGGSSGDFIGDVDHFRLNKRQAVSAEEQTESVAYMITLIQQYYQAVVGQFNKRIETQTLTPKEGEEVGQVLFAYRNASAHFVKQRLNMTGEAPIDSFTKVFNDALETGLIDEDNAREIRGAIFGFRLTFLRGVAAALDLHPEDFPAGLTADTDQFCRYVRTASFCSNRVPQPKPASTSGENAVALPTAVKCRGMMRAGASVTQVALTKEDVAKWTKEELEQCLSELGKLDLDLDLKRVIWSLMKEKEVTRTSGDHLEVRNLLEAAVYDETSLDSLAINATHLETLALIGAHSYPADLLENVAGRIESQTGGDFPTKGSEMMDVLRNVLAFGSMGHLVCGFRDEQLTKLLQKNETAEMLLPIFGQLNSCPNKDALIIMARKAETIYGDASTWSPSLVRSLGLVVSGLTEPARLPVRSFASIDARAIAHAEGRLFEALTEEHLSLFPVEALVYIDTKHFKHLPEKFHYELVAVEEDLPGSGRMLKLMNVYEGNWKEGHEAEMAEIERVRASTEKGAGSALGANVVVMVGMVLTCLVAVGL